MPIAGQIMYLVLQEFTITPRKMESSIAIIMWPTYKHA